MPNPKRRMSKTRTAKRRTHYKAHSPSLGVCANCGEVKMTHRACPSCGYYNEKSLFIPRG